MIKITRLLFDVSGGTRRLINSSTFFGSLSVADLFQRLVALFYSFVDSLLFESDLACFFEVLFAHFFLSGTELCDVSVMALFYIFVSTYQKKVDIRIDNHFSRNPQKRKSLTFQNGVFLEGFDGFFLFDTTQSSFGIVNTATEINSTYWWGFTIVLSSLTVSETTASTATLSTTMATSANEITSSKGAKDGQQETNLQFK